MRGEEGHACQRGGACMVKGGIHGEGGGHVWQREGICGEGGACVVKGHAL